jgi:CubicO group peptidase (beta-lactamase class C family)
MDLFATARFLPRHIRPYPIEAVESRNVAAEVPPGAVGLTRAAVDAIWAAATALYRTGLHPALALCVRHRGQVVLDRSLGHLSGNAPGDPPDAPRVLARHDSLFNLFSASKAVTSMLVHWLDEQGRVHLDDPVAEYLPAFARHGKDWVTLRHVLTHRAGIPAVPVKHADVSLLTDRARILELLCDTHPVSAPGRRLAYHALTGGYVLGAVIEQVTGQDLRDVLREVVLAPHGFATFNYGVPPERVGEVALNAVTGLPAFPPYSWMLERSLGIGVEEAVRISNDPTFLTAVVPSGNIIGTANEGSRFFELLLRGGTLDGVRTFDHRTIRRAVAETSYLEVDSFLGLPVRYGMGFMLGGLWFNPFGARTPRAFGHIGFTAVLAWADPDRDLSACLMTSGKPFITLGQIRFLNLPAVISRQIPPRRG